MVASTSLETVADVGVPPCASTRASLRMSFEEFLACGEDDKAEWVDGELIFMAPIAEDHQEIGRFLLRALSDWLEYHPGGALRYEKFVMRTRAGAPAREPDIFFVAKENLSRLRETYLDGPADLVVEIISPESRARDRGEKFYEYEAGGVREYWLIDPQRRQAEWYQLGDDGIYRAAVIEGGVYRSRVLAGLWLREEWLWQPPKLRDVLKEWKLL